MTVRPTPRRWTLTLLALMAFLFQGYLVQTHIHVAGETAGFAQGAPGHRHAPLGDDRSTCPICQQIAGHGQFLTPAQIVHVAPSATVPTVPHAERSLPFILALSHGWQGRAPPRA
jgi:hypothetical protein